MADRKRGPSKAKTANKALQAGLNAGILPRAAC